MLLNLHPKVFFILNSKYFFLSGYIKISAKYINEPRDLIRISVKDTG